MSIVIVNYGMGNLRSIEYKLRKAEITAKISSDREVIAGADILFLPGVGHFRQGMENIKSMGLFEILNRKVIEEKTPIMGICLGVQLFSKWSEEGEADGFGWIDAVTKRFKFNDSQEQLRIPHIGWNTIKKEREDIFLEGIEPDRQFYFVHSYHVCCNDPKDILTTTFYGYDFVSSIRHGNIFGTQFHPEKSHKKGIEIVKNFVKYCKNV